MNLERLQKIAGSVRTGGKGTVRRKKKAVHKSGGTDDKKLQGTLKRLGVNTIPGIEEVLLINNDGSATAFAAPKVQASIAANTYVVSGNPTHKQPQEVVASMLSSMGGLANMQQLAQLMGGGAGGLPSFNPEGAAEEPEADDEVPELVGDFEQAAAEGEKKEADA
ncbi:hypothetical protein QBZ16_003272 [Prototheca wickerhamii]|uniref:Nascent polypeptide-associated complex subunit beta n=1 Tax=Prototheca wickerhamii TaxID=3111 RepID=A0AAD9IM20_PROWI|nr:hypothetical protein QBZ16_003272 [Prototheca wickerhamii]